MSCPDCKDGLYYPLIGPPENCQTCNLPELGEKTQPEDRMHCAKLSESEVRQREKLIHGFTYIALSDAQLHWIIENKQANFEITITDWSKWFPKSRKTQLSWLTMDCILTDIKKHPGSVVALVLSRFFLEVSIDEIENTFARKEVTLEQIAQATNQSKALRERA